MYTLLVRQFYSGSSVIDENSLNERHPLINRRVWHRNICNDSATLFSREGNKDSVLLKDLSWGGACVCGGYPVKTDSSVSITIDASGIFNRQTRVAWSKQVTGGVWETGLDFMMKD